MSRNSEKHASIMMAAMIAIASHAFVSLPQMSPSIDAAFLTGRWVTPVLGLEEDEASLAPLLKPVAPDDPLAAFPMHAVSAVCPPFDPIGTALCGRSLDMKPVEGDGRVRPWAVSAVECGRPNPAFNTEMSCSRYMGVVDLLTGDFVLESEYDPASGSRSSYTIRGSFSEDGRDMRVWMHGKTEHEDKSAMYVPRTLLLADSRRRRGPYC